MKAIRLQMTVLVMLILYPSFHLYAEKNQSYFSHGILRLSANPAQILYKPGLYLSLSSTNLLSLDWNLRNHIAALYSNKSWAVGLKFEHQSFHPYSSFKFTSAIAKKLSNSFRIGIGLSYEGFTYPGIFRSHDYLIAYGGNFTPFPPLEISSGFIYNPNLSQFGENHGQRFLQSVQYRVHPQAELQLEMMFLNTEIEEFNASIALLLHNHCHILFSSDLKNNSLDIRIMLKLKSFNLSTAWTYHPNLKHINS